MGTWVMAAVLTGVVSGGAMGQVPAVVSIQAPGLSGGVLEVQAGQVVPVSVVVSFSSVFYAFAGAQGDVIASPNLGQSSNVALPLQWGSWGSVQGASIFGVQVFQPAPGFVFPPGPSTANPIEVLTFDWRAPMTPGESVQVSWVPSASLPSVRLYGTPTSPSFVEVQATTVSATFVVIPGPGGVGLAFVTGLLFVARRR